MIFITLFTKTVPNPPVIASVTDFDYLNASFFKDFLSGFLANVHSLFSSDSS